MNLLIANDIGNSETKMFIDGTLIKQPSVVKRVLSKPNVSEPDVHKNITFLLDELFVHVSSKAIKRDGLYFIGKRANVTSDKVENMNIKLGNKSTHDIPILMTLSMIAARSVQLEYEKDGKLPKSISVEVDMTTAIPASEFSTNQAKHLEKRFTEEPHVVIVHVGETTVTVTIEFKTVKVTQEGIPALYSLIENENGILEDYNRIYEKMAQPKDFANKKILHVDIGDGTTEYIYTIGLNPITDACSGAKRGVGHATEEAIQLLKEDTGGFLEVNRQQFMNILRDSTHNLHDLAVQHMEEARFSQAKKILEDVQEKYSDIGGNVDVIAVYGGGSIQFKEELYSDLLDFANNVHCEVLWIPPEYAVDMNVRGLKVINEKILKKRVKG